MIKAWMKRVRVLWCAGWPRRGRRCQGNTCPTLQSILTRKYIVIVLQKNDPELRSMDVVQRIIGFISNITGWPMTTIEYPVRCGICGAKTKGNIITGYRMGCKEEGH